jgi:hypothetical protein
MCVCAGLLAVAKIARGHTWKQAQVPACELRLVDLGGPEAEGAGRVVETLFLGLEERVHCMCLVYTREGEVLVCVGTGEERRPHPGRVGSPASRCVGLVLREVV